MNIGYWKQFKVSTTVLASLLGGLMLSSCGGGGGVAAVSAIINAGIGGTGIVFGPITGFGSVYVNGNKFDTDDSKFIVDGDSSATQANLKLGMVVKLRAELEDGVYTGKALEVIYDDELEGPLTNVQPGTDPALKTAFVFGQEVTFDEGNTIFDDTSFEDLGNEDDPLKEDVVEISGFRTATGIAATYVRFVDDLELGSTEVELRGNITDLMGSSSPPSQTFRIDTIDIATNGGTVLDVEGGVLLPLQYVEVKGVIQSLTSILATKIEQEDEDFGEDVEDISLQGVVSGFTDIDSDFFVGGQRVNAKDAELSPASLMLVDGLTVEVEGEIVGGKLIADEIEAREAETRLRSYIGQVNTTAGWFEVIYPVAGPNAVVVYIDSQTAFEDETGAVSSETFSINDLTANVDFVRIEGREINGKVIAGVVKRTGTSSSLRLEGRVEEYFPDVSITVLGVAYQLDPGTTTYDPSKPAVLTSDDIVEIRDRDDGSINAPGIADEVELDN